MKPVVLLVAGTLTDASIFDDVSALLGDQAEVRVAVPSQSSIREMAVTAWNKLDDVSPERPVVLGGFSLGGYVALEMLVHPRRSLSGAVLISTSAQPETPEATAIRQKTIAAIERDFAKVVEALVGINLHVPAPERVVRLRNMMFEIGADVAIRQLRATSGRPDHRQALAGLRLPTVVLCGKHDRVVPPVFSSELAGLIPAARCEIADDAGHMLPLEQPGLIATTFKALLPQ